MFEVAIFPIFAFIVSASLTMSSSTSLFILLNGTSIAPTCTINRSEKMSLKVDLKWSHITADFVVAEGLTSTKNLRLIELESPTINAKGFV